MIMASTLDVENESLCVKASLYKGWSATSLVVQFQASCIAGLPPWTYDQDLSSKLVFAEEMVKLRRYSTGFRAEGGRKMRHVLLWFIFTGVAKETISAAEVSKSSEHSKGSSNFPNGESTLAISEVKSKSEDSVDDMDFKSDSSSDRMIRHVPPTKIRIDDLSEDHLENNSETDKVQKIRITPLNVFIFPYIRLKKSEELNNDEAENNALLDQLDYVSDNELRNEHIAFKRPETIIPMMRFGRTSLQKRQSNPISVIPYPRLGRSLRQNEDEVNKDGKDTDEMSFTEKHVPEEENEKNYDEFEDSEDSELQIQKKYLEDYDSMIPYPRPGRKSTLEDLASELHERRTDEAYTDYVLPQIRYGRSMLLLSPPSLPKTEETLKNKSPQTFVLPYPRPGRSSKNPMKVGNAKTEQLNLPNLRPENRRYMIPYARLGRSTLGTLYEMEGKDRAYSNDETFIGLKVNPFLLKGEENILSDKFKEKGESDSAFVIPYPRPGKKSKFKTSKEKANNAEKGIADYVVPYPRPGKKSTGQQSLMVKNNNYNVNQHIPAQKYVLPYPRPGRSVDYLLDSDVEFNMKNINLDEDFLDRMFKTNADIQEIMENIKSENINRGESRDIVEPLQKKYENKFMIPNARFGRSFHDVVPYPRPGRSTDYQFQEDDEANTFDDSGHGTIFKLYYSESEKDNSAQRLKRSDLVVPDPQLRRSGTVVPYPRLGRSDSVIPYPRFGKSNTIVPYPRFGRSNSVVIYPRYGKSTSVVPYPRPGRSNTVVPFPRPGRSSNVVPYPRPGRSSNVVPYPRPGRSNTVVPFPRPGRSSNVVPYPRPGRSNTVVPFPRPGRSSNVVPYPRPGRSNTVVPFPRPGRSSNVVPYPRPGRSNTVVPFPRPGRSNTIVPFPRPGRSSNVVPYPRPGRSNTIVPFPRPGRSNTVVPFPRPGRSNTIVPFPRPGRSNTVVPFPRPGRSSNLIPYPRPGRSSNIIPYPRPGRSENSADDEMYNLKNERTENELIMPYPRFDRSAKNQGYVLPHPRIGRSEDDEEYLVNDDTVILNSNIDRSQEEATPSPSTLNSVHKLNKHMLSSVDDSIYLLPYPRPGRYSE